MGGSVIYFEFYVRVFFLDGIEEAVIMIVDVVMVDMEILVTI